MKDLPTSRFRRHGGLLAAMLGCGTVAHVHLLEGAESATQVAGVLGEVL